MVDWRARLQEFRGKFNLWHRAVCEWRRGQIRVWPLNPSDDFSGELPKAYKGTPVVWNNLGVSKPPKPPANWSPPPGWVPFDKRKST